MYAVLPEFTVEPVPEGAVFTLQRPSRLNALTQSLRRGLIQAVDHLEAEGRSLLVITAAGDRAFCAGTDLTELEALDTATRIARCDEARAQMLRLSRSPVVTVAAINGLAYGGGLELAMACTLRIAVPHAQLSLPEVKLGLLPAYAGTQFLPTLVGPARALELMLTGRVVTAQEALAMGLIHRVAAPHAPVHEQALAFGREVTRHAPSAIAAIRACVAAAGAQVTTEGLAVEAAQVQTQFAHPDAQEGMTAFLEKRMPQWCKDPASAGRE